MYSQPRTGKCHAIKRRREWFRNMVDEIKGVHYGRSGPGGEDRRTPEVPTPPEPECSGKGWWTMLEWEGATPNACVDAGGGVDEDAASCVSIEMTFWSIKSCTAPRRVMQLSVECPMTRWKSQK